MKGHHIFATIMFAIYLLFYVVWGLISKGLHFPAFVIISLVWLVLFKLGLHILLVRDVNAMFAERK